MVYGSKKMYKKKPMASKARKTYRKKAAPQRSLVVKQAPFGNRYIAKLKYSTVVAVDPALNTAQGIQFAANGMFDPNLSGTAGWQPRGFQQIMANFGTYTVIGAKINVKVISWTQVDTTRVTLFRTDDATPLGNENAQLPSKWSEHIGAAKSMWLSNNVTRDKFPSLTSSVNIKKFKHVKDLMGAPRFSGSVSANPTDLTYFWIYAEGLNGADISAVTYAVEIDYIAVFTDPIAPSPSQNV